MGFNTVVFLLNDFGDSIERNPHTVAYMLTHTPSSREYKDVSYIANQAQHIAGQHGEGVPHTQALEVFPTFHADNRKFFMAGGNSMSELTPLRVQRDRKTGRKVVVLDLPDYLQDKKRVI